MIPDFENLFSTTHKEGSGSSVHQEAAKKPEEHKNTDISTEKKDEHSGGLFGFSLTNVFSNIKDDALGIMGDISKKSQEVAGAAVKTLPALSFEGVNLQMVAKPVEKAADWIWKDDPFLKPSDQSNAPTNGTADGGTPSGDGTSGNDGSADSQKNRDKSSSGLSGFLGDFLSKGTHVTKTFDSLFSNLFSSDQPGGKTVTGHDATGETKTTIENGVIKHKSAGDQTAVTADGVVSKDDKGNVAWFDKASHTLGEAGTKGTQVKAVNGQLQFNYNGNEVDWTGKTLVLHEPDGTTKEISKTEVITNFDSLLNQYETDEAKRARRFIQNRGESAGHNPITSAQNGVTSFNNAVTSKDETGTAAAYTDGRLELVVDGKSGKEQLHVWVQANHQDMKVQLADGKTAYLHYDASTKQWQAARGQHIHVEHEKDGSLVVDGQKIGTNQGGGNVQIGDHTINHDGSIQNEYGVTVSATDGTATATEASGTPGQKSHTMAVGKDGVSTVQNPDGGCTKVDGKTGSVAELDKHGVAIASQKGTDAPMQLQTPDGQVTLGGTDGHPTAKLWNGDEFTSNGDLKRKDGTTLHKDGSVDFSDGTHIDANGAVSQNGEYLGSLKNGGGSSTAEISGSISAVSSQIASLAASLAGKSGADAEASKAQLAALGGELAGLRGTAIAAGDTVDVLKIDSTQGTISSLLGKSTAVSAEANAK